MKTSPEPNDLPTEDPIVFGRIVTRYERSIFGFLGRMGFAQADAEELAQEVFLRAWRNRYHFDPARGKLSTWLFTIARNLAVDEINRSRRAPEHGAAGIDIADLANPASENDPAVRFEVNRQVERLRTALLAMSLNDRTAIALFYVHDLSNEEAAKLADCSVGSFRTRLSRARRRLALLMQQGVIDEFE